MPNSGPHSSIARVAADPHRAGRCHPLRRRSIAQPPTRMVRPTLGTSNADSLAPRRDSDVAGGLARGIEPGPTAQADPHAPGRDNTRRHLVTMNHPTIPGMSPPARPEAILGHSSRHGPFDELPQLRWRIRAAGSPRYLRHPCSPRPRSLGSIGNGHFDLTPDRSLRPILVAHYSRPKSVGTSAGVIPDEVKVVQNRLPPTPAGSPIESRLPVTMVTTTQRLIKTCLHRQRTPSVRFKTA